MPRLETLVTRQLAPGRKGWQKLSFEYFSFHKQNNWQPSPRRLCCNIMQSLAFPHTDKGSSRWSICKLPLLQKSFSGFSDLSKLFSSWRLRLEFGSQLAGDFPFLFGVECFRFLFCLCSFAHLYFYHCWPPKNNCAAVSSGRKPPIIILEWKSGFKDVAFFLCDLIWRNCAGVRLIITLKGVRGPQKGDNITS